jgi:Xaa-Pro dipeptidase
MNGDIERWASEYNDRFPIYVIHQDQKPVLSSGELRLDHVGLMPAMDACRVIKDCHEIGLIERANQISAAAHTAVLTNIGQLTNEAQIQGIFLDTCISNGAHHQAYDIIAAAGENAATLHYTRNNDPLKDQQLILLDAGAEWNCYASDVTRTFPRTSGWPSQEARDIYHIVLKMQEKCIYRIKEGVRFLDLHWLAHDTAIYDLLNLGIFKGGSVAEIRRSGASRVFFPHGLGHHLGLEVHDVSPEYLLGQQSRDRNRRLFNSAFMPPCTESASVLKAGMVVTVEPGIYFSRLALEDAKSRPSVLQYIDMDVVERYMSVGGVRIEDDILVTKDGFRNLTTAPKKIPWLDAIPSR